METKTSRIHPLIAVAAVSVTLFSLAGVAVLTGVMPGSKAESRRNRLRQPPAPTAQPQPLAANLPAGNRTRPHRRPAAAAAPAAPKPEGKVVHKSSPQKLAAKANAHRAAARSRAATGSRAAAPAAAGLP